MCTIISDLTWRITSLLSPAPENAKICQGEPIAPPRLPMCGSVGRPKGVEQTARPSAPKTHLFPTTVAKRGRANVALVMTQWRVGSPGRHPPRLVNEATTNDPRNARSVRPICALPWRARNRFQKSDRMTAHQCRVNGVPQGSHLGRPTQPSVYLVGHPCPTRARTGMSDEMSDIGVRWVVEPTRRIPLFEQQSDLSARQVLEWRGPTTCRTCKAALQSGSAARAVLGPDRRTALPE